MSLSAALLLLPCARGCGVVGHSITSATGVLDSATDIATMDPTVGLGSGYIAAWEFWNGRPSATLSFQVWRKESPTTWRLTCQDSIVTPATVGAATVPSASGCSVSAGDVIGWWQSGTGVIPADTYQGTDCTAPDPKCVFWKYPTPVKRPGETNDFLTSGQRRVYSVGVHLCSAWGRDVLLLLFCASLVYVGGGVAYSHRVLGKRIGVDGWEAMHPHSAKLWELRALVADGVRFARARLAGEAVGYSAVAEQEEEGGEGRSPQGQGQGERKKHRSGKSESSPGKGGGGGDAEAPAAADDAEGADVVGVGEGDRVGAGLAGLQEEAVVGANLHSSQAKIKVTGLG